MGCLKILLLLPLEGLKCLNLLALWEGKQYFKLNYGINQSIYVLFHFMVEMAKHEQAPCQSTEQPLVLERAW